MSSSLDRAEVGFTQAEVNDEAFGTEVVDIADSIRVAIEHVKLRLDDLAAVFVGVDKFEELPNGNLRIDIAGGVGTFAVGDQVRIQNCFEVEEEYTSQSYYYSSARRVQTTRPEEEVFKAKVVKVSTSSDRTSLEITPAKEPNLHDDSRLTLTDCKHAERIRTKRAITLLHGLKSGASDDFPLRSLLLADKYEPVEGVKDVEGLFFLDEDQNEAYVRAMRFGDEPILHIHGGPGAGKTTLICEIVKGHMAEGRRVLVLSHSNKGAQVPAVMLKKQGVEVNIAGNVVDEVDPDLIEDRFKYGIEFPHIPEGAGKEKRAAIMEMYRAQIAHKMDERLSGGGVAFSTFGSLEGDQLLRKMRFDAVIIDEATRARWLEMGLALRSTDTQAILVGDHKQMGTIPLSPQERARLEKAVMEPENISQQVARELVRIFEEGFFTAKLQAAANPHKELPYVFLSKCRRCLPAITRVLSELIYGGELKVGREACEVLGDGVVKWIDTKNIGAKEKNSGPSKSNPKEADVIVDMLLDKVLGEGVDPAKIGVIATYDGQVKAIKSRLRRKLWNKKALYADVVRNVATVDSFQGDERDIIIASLTRSNEEGEIGFVEERRRIGVMIGRAKDELYVVGDSATLVDRNDALSAEFFGQMKSLIAENGDVEVLGEAKHVSRQRGHNRSRR